MKTISSELKYKLVDQCGTEIARGDQLEFSINVDLENKTMTVRHGATNTVCDIAGGDKFAISFDRIVYPS